MHELEGSALAAGQNTGILGLLASQGLSIKYENDTERAQPCLLAALLLAT